ncbi:MAG: 3'-5' exonuclease [Chitinophagales bacterium]|nr:3'-5' exonuclease [Chitinophagaceae bacterium]MCB9063638.1 3'-5' exonuclease [Chitinophagales bacterium]
MAQLTLKKPIVFLDLETTGTDPAKDRIVELALIKMNPNGTRDRYVKRINPGMPIPESSTAIHGISDEDVKDAPMFKQLAKEIYEWMKGCDLGGYNAVRFDIPLLAEEMLRSGVEVDFTERNFVDVQQIFFKMETRTLSAAYEFYCNKTLENAHSAEADILATIEVLEAQLDRYNNLENDIKALHTFTNNNDFVDYARRIVLKDGVPVFNFGKYKGKSVEQVFTEEPQYYDWMMNADFPLHTKQKITEILTRMKLRNSRLKS